MDDPHPNPYADETIDRDTHQQHQSATAPDLAMSPFDNSPKASMLFFSTHSPRHQTDLLQFDSSRRYEKDSLPTLDRRLKFQDGNSSVCQEDQFSQQEFYSPETPNKPSLECESTQYKNKKIQKSKNSKGLKSLSIGVYQIVTAKGQTSYKQVASTLIQKLNRSVTDGKQKLKFQELKNKKIEKDQHNIKRRVYDALNVLISAELLRKEGKRVICNYDTTKCQEKRKQILQQKQLSMKNQLTRLQMVLKEKRIQTERLLKKKQKIANLCVRNQRKECPSSERIRFPFIGVKSQFQDMKMISIGKRDVEIQYNTSPSSLIFMGDIDMVECTEFQRLHQKHI